jgi:hypothetical protein
LPCSGLVLCCCDADEVAQRCGGLLRHHAVAEDVQLGAVRQVEVGDEAGRQAHEPLGEGRCQARLSAGAELGRRWGDAPDYGFPALDGGGVRSPDSVSGVGCCAPGSLPTAAGRVSRCLPLRWRMEVLPLLATGVGSSREQVACFRPVGEEEETVAVVSGTDGSGP